MLTHTLIHPPLLEALATAGHGSRILIADGNFPYLTVRAPRARLVHLNLAPGLLTVNQVVEVLLTAVNVESAAVMRPEADDDVPAHADYRNLLTEATPFTRYARFDFYDAIRSEDVGLIVATGDQRLYANLLLTIGLG